MYKLLSFLLLAFFVLAVQSRAQDKTPNKMERQERIDHQEVFSAKEMDKMWGEFSKDKNFTVIMKEAMAKGFTRRKDEKAAWGFRGVHVGPKEERSEVLFCVFDLEKKGSKESCSMVWARKGKDFYKAYLVVPEGKDLNESNEWFVDESGKVQKAHSWGRCFLRALKSFCGPTCITAMGPCLIVAGATVTAAGIGGVTSPAVFAACVGGICGGCVAVAAIGCAF